MATLVKDDEKTGAAPTRRGFYEPYEEYHICWYPVMLSAELEPGQVKSMNFCDSRIAVFRGEDGVARAVSARCKHMGADVGLGDVVGNNVRCPFHHWEYDGSGACVRIPSGDKIPKDTTLFKFPCEESQGLIWVLLGKEATVPVPALPDCEEGKTLMRSFEIDFSKPIHVEPWVFSTNVFDFAHFKAVHHFEMDEVTKFSEGDCQGWEGEIGGGVHLRIELHGIANVISYMHKPGEPVKRQLAGSCPKGDEGLKLFMTIFVDLEDDSEEARQKAEKQLDEYEAFHRKIPEQDLTVLNSIEFGKARLTEVDKDLAGLLAYISRYPRTTIRELEADA